MRRWRSWAILWLVAALLTPARAEAGEVRSGYRVDGDSVLVDVENGSDSAIRVKSIVLRFFDTGGAPLGTQTLLCDAECDVAEGAAGTFGPIACPQDWDRVEVASVGHVPIAAVERPARRAPPRSGAK